MQPESSSKLTRMILESVPRVNFYEGGHRCPEDFTFPSSLRACLEYMGENYGCDYFTAPQEPLKLCCTYAYIMSACGYAFSLGWKPGWHMDNNSILLMSTDPEEPFRRAFQAVGHSYEIISKRGDNDDETRFRRSIIESIRDKRRPLLAFGVIGPPNAASSLATTKMQMFSSAGTSSKTCPNSTQAQNSSPQATSEKKTGSRTHTTS